MNTKTETSDLFSSRYNAIDKGISDTTVRCVHCRKEVPIADTGTEYDPETNETFLVCSTCFYADGDGWSESDGAS